MFFGQGMQVRLGGLFDTHPPLDERIRRVQPALRPVELPQPARGRPLLRSCDRRAAGLAGAAPPAAAARGRPRARLGAHGRRERGAGRHDGRGQGGLRRSACSRRCRPGCASALREPEQARARRWSRCCSRTKEAVMEAAAARRDRRAPRSPTRARAAPAAHAPPRAGLPPAGDRPRAAGGQAGCRPRRSSSCSPRWKR